MTDPLGAGHGEGVSVCAQSAEVPAVFPAEARADRPSLAEVYRAHYGFVWRILRRMGVPDPVLEDAAQDVFIVVHRRQDAYDPSASMRSWLFGIARRVAADVHRGRRRARRRLEAVPSPSPGPDPEDATRRAEAAELVTAFLDRLDDGKRLVFVLADIEGLTAPEIADALGIKLNTVYSRLRVARHKFERALAQHRARTDGELGPQTQVAQQGGGHGKAQP